MVVSQSCDVSWRKHIQVAPVGKAESDFKDEKLQKLRENEYGYLFFLPADAAAEFPASYADLSRITSVDASYFRPDALLKRLSSRGMIELQNSLTDLHGRAIGFTVDDVVPQAAMYGCISCFTLGNPQIHKSISTGGKFPDCPGCGAKALWIKLP
jgi:hypothetical protein